jgi:polar amino acid transport system substrate-binding protein
MFTRKFIITAIVILTTISPFKALAYNALQPKKPVIFIVGSEHCPYNCYNIPNKTGVNSNVELVDRHDPINSKIYENQGYVVDIVRAIFSKLGHEVKYRVMSRERAILYVKNGAADILITEEKQSQDGYIIAKQAIGLTNKSFYTSVNSGWRYSGISSLERVTLGIIDGEEYSELDDYIEKNKNSKIRIQSTSGDDGININMRKLAKQRISAIFENQYVVDYHRKTMGLADEVIPAGEIKESADNKLYLAFSANKENTKQYVKQFDAGIVELRKTGELAEILNKYGVEDWQRK